MCLQAGRAATEDRQGPSMACWRRFHATGGGATPLRRANPGGSESLQRARLSNRDEDRRGDGIATARLLPASGATWQTGGLGVLQHPFEGRKGSENQARAGGASPPYPRARPWRLEDGRLAADDAL